MSPIKPTKSKDRPILTTGCGKEKSELCCGTPQSLVRDFCVECGARRPPIDGEGYCIKCAVVEIDRLKKLIKKLTGMCELTGDNCG